MGDAGRDGAKLPREIGPSSTMESSARRGLVYEDEAPIIVQFLVPAAKHAGAVPVIAVPLSALTSAATQEVADTGVRVMQFPRDQAGLD